MQLPISVTLTPSSNLTLYYLASYDFTLEEAGSDFNDGEILKNLKSLLIRIIKWSILLIFHPALKYAFDDGGGDLFVLHSAAWRSVWTDGKIEVDGNLELSKIINGCLYYILSALPVSTVPNIVQRQFYGLSPGGLAYGDYLMDYQGHSFWDTETWMFPSILYLYPRAAEQMLNYRLSVIAAARDLANQTGYAGARYPWEGAVTGREVTPDCCVDTRELQVI